MTFSDSWKEAIAAGAGIADEVEPDDGTHTVAILDARTEVTNNGKELARVRLKLKNGDRAGGYFDHTLFLSSPFALEKSIRALRHYGIDVRKVTELEDLHEQMKTIIGSTAVVEVAHEGGYLRVDVLDVTPPERSPDDAAAPDDNTPF